MTARGKTQHILETDLYDIWDAFRAVEVVRGRARTWATKPHVYLRDVKSLNVELRLVERGLIPGRKHRLYFFDGDMDRVWWRLLDWCSEPYTGKKEIEWLLAEMDKAEEKLCHAQAFLREQLGWGQVEEGHGREEAVRGTRRAVSR